MPARQVPGEDMSKQPSSGLACPPQPMGTWRRPAQRVPPTERASTEPSSSLTLRRSSPTSRSFVLAPLRALHLDPGSGPTRPPTKRTAHQLNHHQPHSGHCYAKTVLTQPAVSDMPVRDAQIGHAEERRRPASATYRRFRGIPTAHSGSWLSLPHRQRRGGRGSLSNGAITLLREPLLNGGVFDDAVKLTHAFSLGGVLLGGWFRQQPLSSR
jgi:hypothetical protein